MELLKLQICFQKPNYHQFFDKYYNQLHRHGTRWLVVLIWILYLVLSNQVHRLPLL